VPIIAGLCPAILFKVPEVRRTGPFRTGKNRHRRRREVFLADLNVLIVVHAIVLNQIGLRVR
jgi:hypothetical protein